MSDTLQDEPMSEKKKNGRLLTQAEADELLARWQYHAARAVAFDEAAGYAMTRAQQCFARHDDDDAGLLRSVGDHFQKASKIEREKQADARTD